MWKFNFGGQSRIRRESRNMPPPPKNLAELPAEDLLEFFDSFDHVLSDCDGVIYILYNLFEGVSASIAALKGLGKTIQLVTNNATVPRQKISDVMRRSGVQISRDEVMNPAKATADHLKQIGFTQKAYVIGMSGIRTELEEAGIRIANPYKPELFLSEDLAELAKNIQTMDPEVGAVIVCMDVNATFLMLNKAVRYLEDPNVLFIATGVFLKVPIAKNVTILGSEYCQDLVARGSGRDYLNFGKPSKDFQEFLKTNIKHDPNRTLFIGDTLEQDINFANELGYKTLLVLTGMSSLEQTKTCDDIMVPDYYVNSFGDLHKLIEKAKSVRN